MASDLGCWDCHLYQAVHDVRCAKHRSSEEQARLEAAEGARLQQRVNFAKLKLSMVTRAADRPPGFKWVQPIEYDATTVRPLTDDAEHHEYRRLLRLIRARENHDPGDEDVKR